jgi:zinc/manganese transport system permease protein
MTETLSSLPLFSPFIEFGFMRRALAGCLALSLGATPVGVFLMLRRMSLAGDAMSHAILPGAAIGYLIAGLSLPAMTLGGLVAGLAVAVLAGGVARNTVIKEDTSLATFYLLSLSAGVLIISLRGSSVDLLHVLFGSVLALDDAGTAPARRLRLAIGRRARNRAAPVRLEGCDPAFLARISRLAPLAHYGFMILLVLNLVAGFHALGTLMAVGIMILPAAAARLWVCNARPAAADRQLHRFFRVADRPAAVVLRQPAGRAGHRADARRDLPAVDGGRTTRAAGQPLAAGLAFRTLNPDEKSDARSLLSMPYRLCVILLLSIGQPCTAAGQRPAKRCRWSPASASSAI